MTLLTNIVTTANQKATDQTADPLVDDNPLAGKFFLTESLEKEQLNFSSLPKATIHLGALDASIDNQDGHFGCTQNMQTQIKVWLICDVEDVYELIIHCNRAILGQQPNQFITEIILDSGAMKEINGNKCWYDLSYIFRVQTKSE